MGKNTGFLEFERQDRVYESIDSRRQTWKEFIKPLPEPELERQAARCMDCGIPFCHNGCPVNNLIPDWNDLVYRDQWESALHALHSTNNFPEFTGRICPAPCESAWCVPGPKRVPCCCQDVCQREAGRVANRAIPDYSEASSEHVLGCTIRQAA